MSFRTSLSVFFLSSDSLFSRSTVVGLPLEFYSELNEASQYCGQYVVVTNPVSGENVTAQVQDASTQNNTLSVSMGTWKALNGSEDNLHYVNWRRANETEVAAFKKAQTSSTGSSSSSSWTAPSSSSSVAASSSAAASKEWKGEPDSLSTLFLRTRILISLSRSASSRDFLLVFRSL